MNDFDLESLLTRAPEHPSELALDEWIAGLLSATRAAEVEAHCAGCPACLAFVAERREGLAAEPSLDADAIFARIRASAEAADAPAPAGRPTLRARLAKLFDLRGAGLVLVGAAAAVVVMLAIRAPDPAGLGGPVVRAKGTLALEVARKTEGGVQPMVSGDVFRPDDALRFIVTLPTRGQIMIVGVEADGTIYPAWPLAGHGANPVLPAGEAQALDGAVRLDGKPGVETFYLVHCPEKVYPNCASQGPGAAPLCPDACRAAPFVVKKQPQ